MDKQLLTACLLILFAVATYILVTRGNKLEHFGNLKIGRLNCDCYRDHIHPKDGLCWKRDVHGHYLEGPRGTCASGPCACWPKHTSYMFGKCHRRGQRHGVRPVCNKGPYNV